MIVQCYRLHKPPTTSFLTSSTIFYYRVHHSMSLKQQMQRYTFVVSLPKFLPRWSPIHQHPTPSQPSETSPHSQSEVPTEHLLSSGLREFNEHMTRRSCFLWDFQRYDPVQNMQALANRVFDLSENVRRIGHESSETGCMLKIVGDDQDSLAASVDEAESFEMCRGYCSPRTSVE